MKADCLIIGGGIIGLCLARELRRQGVEKITILEKNPACGMESSHAAAGMLAPQSEADRIDDFFRFCAESRDSYPNFAAELFDESGIDIELDQTGTLYLAFNDADAEELEKRFVWQQAASLKIEKLSAKEVLEIEPNTAPNVVCGLRFPSDWQVENRRIVKALSKQFAESQTINSVHGKVESLIFENDKIIGAATAVEKFYAPVVVVAAGAWTSLIKDKFDLLADIKVKPVRGQMLEFGDENNLFCHVVYSRRGYVVPKKNQRILVGATVADAGFDQQPTNAETVFLQKTAFEISLEFAKLNLQKTWAGLRPSAPDKLPVLGAFPAIENLYAATAHYRNGILLAPLTAKILAEKIVAKIDSPYLEIFSPRRFYAKRTAV